MKKIGKKCEGKKRTWRQVCRYENFVYIILKKVQILNVSNIVDKNVQTLNVSNIVDKNIVHKNIVDKNMVHKNIVDIFEQVGKFRVYT